MEHKPNDMATRLGGPDVVEEAKLQYGVWDGNEHNGMMIVEGDLFRDLIAEVGRMRSQCEANAEYDYSRRAEHEKQIESLTAELEESRKDEGVWRKEYEMARSSMCTAIEQKEKLEAENKALEEFHKLAERMGEDIVDLKSQLEKAEKRVGELDHINQLLIKHKELSAILKEYNL